MTRRLLVASTGGHLEQLARLEPRLRPEASYAEFVTFDDQQSRSLLAGRRVSYVPRIPPRGLRQALQAVPHAIRILRAGRFDSVVSTGSAIAVPFMLAARSMGVECHYIESAARTDGPSLTGRILARVPGMHLYSQYPDWALDPWGYGGSVFDGFTSTETDERRTTSVDRVVVTFGTMQGYPYRRAVEVVHRLLPEFAAPDATVLWQVGDTPVDDLPIQAAGLVPSRDLQQAITEADLVIAHAGVGSSLQFLDAGLCPVLLPRSAARREHIDDHQWLIARELAGRNLAVSRDADDLTVSDIETALSRRALRAETTPFALRSRLMHQLPA
ncbi:MAG: glycosyltransferase [Brachybacterium sp.]|nr:glycosyltransferase [Brachybacterium sp.]